MILDYMLVGVLVFVGGLSGRAAWRKEERQTKAAFILWTLLAIPSVLFLLFFADGLLSQNELLVQGLFDAVPYTFGLSLLPFPLSIGCSWIVGYAIFRTRAKA